MQFSHEQFSELARGYGFERVYFIEPGSFDLGGNRFGLVADAKEAFPFADSIAVLIRPYAPYSESERIPAYYPASNRAYHGMKALIAELNARGVRAEKAEIPVKFALEKAGIGVQLKNSLRLIPPFGTRVVILTVAVAGLAPLEYAENIPYPCANCHACERACPAGAICGGLDLSKCMRLEMESALHSDGVREKQRTYIGCEVCQYACPMNVKLDRAEPTAEEKAAFDTLALAMGEAAPARKLVGKNITSNGRLTAEALAFAARDALLPQDELKAAVEKAEASPFEAVRDAARYAEMRAEKNS